MAEESGGKHTAAFITGGCALLAALITGTATLIANHGTSHAIDGAGAASPGLTASPTAGTPSPTVTPTPEPPTPTEPLVRHKGPLVLAVNGIADLDATPEHVTWQDGFGDIWFSPPSVNWTSNQAHAFLSNKPASYATCHEGPFSVQEIAVTAIERAKTLCVLTTDERISAIRIDKASEEELRLYATTYNKEGD